MWLVIIGILMLILKFFSVGFMGAISWWWCFLPFGLAFVYWEFIDKALQITPKREMAKQMRKAKERRRKHVEEVLSVNKKRKN